MSPARSHPTIVVLAAGGGSRFVGHGGGPKLAQPLGGASVLARTLGLAVASGLPVVVVTVAALVDCARQVVAARDIVLLPPIGSASREPLGVGYSIAAGVTARAQAPGWLILPGDMPLVRPESVVEVGRALAGSPVAYAQHHGRPGHPVGFGGELYSELARLSGEEGLRRLLVRYPSAGVEVPDPGVLFDINTRDDLERARQNDLPVRQVAWRQPVPQGQADQA